MSLNITSSIKDKLYFIELKDLWFYLNEEKFLENSVIEYIKNNLIKKEIDVDNLILFGLLYGILENFEAAILHIDIGIDQYKNDIDKIEALSFIRDELIKLKDLTRTPCSGYCQQAYRVFYLDDNMANPQNIFWMNSHFPSYSNTLANLYFEYLPDIKLIKNIQHSTVDKSLLLITAHGAITTNGQFKGIQIDNRPIYNEELISLTKVFDKVFFYNCDSNDPEFTKLFNEKDIIVCSNEVSIRQIAVFNYIFFLIFRKTNDFNSSFRISYFYTRSIFNKATGKFEKSDLSINSFLNNSLYPF